MYCGKDFYQIACIIFNEKKSLEGNLYIWNNFSDYFKMQNRGYNSLDSENVFSRKQSIVCM